MESVKKIVDNTKNVITQNKVVFGVIVVAVFSLGLYVFKNQEKFAVNLNLNGFSGESVNTRNNGEAGQAQEDGDAPAEGADETPEQAELV